MARDFGVENPHVSTVDFLKLQDLMSSLIPSGISLELPYRIWWGSTLLRVINSNIEGIL